MENDRIFIYNMIALAAVVIGVLVWAVFMGTKHSAKRQQLMPNCEYLGEPKYLNDVSFFDCNGTIVMKRIKQ
jgi:hypothetical protein